MHAAKQFELLLTDLGDKLQPAASALATLRADPDPHAHFVTWLGDRIELERPAWSSTPTTGKFDSEIRQDLRQVQLENGQCLTEREVLELEEVILSFKLDINGKWLCNQIEVAKRFLANRGAWSFLVPAATSTRCTIDYHIIHNCFRVAQSRRTKQHMLRLAKEILYLCITKVRLKGDPVSKITQTLYEMDGRPETKQLTRYATNVRRHYSEGLRIHGLGTGIALVVPCRMGRVNLSNRLQQGVKQYLSRSPGVSELRQMWSECMPKICCPKPQSLQTGWGDDTGDLELLDDMFALGFRDMDDDVVDMSEIA